MVGRMKMQPLESVAAFAKQHPALAYKVQDVMGRILDIRFGEERWYKQAKAYCERLNQQALGEERCIPGTVFSGLWLTLATKSGAVHCDHNVVGPSFLLSTYNTHFEMEGALAVEAPGGNYQRPHYPGLV